MKATIRNEDGRHCVTLVSKEGLGTMAYHTAIAVGQEFNDIEFRARIQCRTPSVGHCTVTFSIGYKMFGSQEKHIRELLAQHGVEVLNATP